MKGQRHERDIGNRCGIHHSAFDKPSEVEDDVLAGEMFGDILDGLTRLQSDDAVLSQSGTINIGGGVIEIIGDEECTAMLGVADGVRRLTLPSFDRVEEHGHGCIGYRIVPIVYG